LAPKERFRIGWPYAANIDSTILALRLANTIVIWQANIKCQSCIVVCLTAEILGRACAVAQWCEVRSGWQMSKAIFALKRRPLLDVLHRIFSSQGEYRENASELDR
jgi:hypothetical protein